jgi:hypothetical protein
MAEELRTAVAAPGRGEFEPRDGRPVVSATVLPAVPREIFERNMRQVGLSPALPEGLVVFLAISDTERFTSYGIWRTLEDGRRFFAESVAQQGADLTREMQYADIVRFEYRLANLRPGVGAELLVPGTDQSPDRLVCDVVTVGFAIDDTAGRTMSEAYRRLFELDAAPDFAHEREQGLLLEFSAVIDGGIQIICVHDDPDKSKRFIEDIALRQGRQAFADWPEPQISTVRFEVLQCMLDASVLGEN